MIPETGMMMLVLLLAIMMVMRLVMGTTAARRSLTFACPFTFNTKVSKWYNSDLYHLSFY